MLAVKGVALSVQLYGNPTLRDPRDIDLLVDATTFSEAGAPRRGRRPPRRPCLVAAPGCRVPAWIKEDEYMHRETGFRIELHHRLSDNPAFIACDFSKLWRERDDVEILRRRLAPDTAERLGRGAAALFAVVAAPYLFAEERLALLGAPGAKRFRDAGGLGGITLARPPLLAIPHHMGDEESKDWQQDLDRLLHAAQVEVVKQQDQP
jgi:hypothetical protein